jgi:alanyl-tRNA synthetase
MTAREIRRAYLRFFESKKHQIVPRASLVPQGDPTTLFTGSGMQPMVPYLLGEPYPEGLTRVTDSQPVFRAVDIDEVGDSEHLTLFEMLGNWSFGDYSKQQQIPWIAEFLFDIIKLNPQNVYVTCYIGNPKLNIPKDTEAIELWQAEFKKRGIDPKVVELSSSESGDKFGMQDGRIFLYDGKENWWSRGGDEDGTPLGDPCGPCSEMFYDFGEQYHDETKYGKIHPASDSPQITEIGNNVFMGYRKNSPTEFVELDAPNIDHGAGLERLAMASIGIPDISKIDLINPITKQLELITGKSSDENHKAFRVVADHIKSAYWLACDGVVPSNTGQGYVLRRLMRRAIKFALDLGITENLSTQISPVIAQIYGEDFPEIDSNFDQILSALQKEEQLFRQTLIKGLKEFEKSASSGGVELSGNDIFRLYDTYGFPAELSVEEASMHGVKLNPKWKDQFDSAMNEQKERSRTASAGQFKGGLADHSDISIKYHTATHLMYRALRNILGDHVIQRGSNITPERLRFDFTHPQKVTPEEIKLIEDMVNEQIQKDWEVTWREENTKQALADGVMGAFGDKYGEVVKVYTVGDPDGQNYSREICGGPHVERTGKLSEGGLKFKVKKEESSSAGIRRIKAVLV